MRLLKVFVLIFTVLLFLQTVWFIWVFSGSMQPVSSETIAIFGGEASRTQKGIYLAREGFASHLVFAGGHQEKVINEFQSTVALLSEMGVYWGKQSASTFEDALCIAKIIRKDDKKIALVVSSFYHLPRACFFLNALLIGQRVTLLPVATEEHHLRKSWHFDQRSVEAVLGEAIEFWGSMIELAIYGITAKTVSEIPWLMSAKTKLKEKVLNLKRWVNLLFAATWSKR